MCNISFLFLFANFIEIIFPNKRSLRQPVQTYLPPSVYFLYFRVFVRFQHLSWKNDRKIAIKMQEKPKFTLTFTWVLKANKPEIMYSYFFLKVSKTKFTKQTLHLVLHCWFLMREKYSMFLSQIPTYLITYDVDYFNVYFC